MKKAGIICAGDDELRPFLEILTEFKVTKHAQLDFYDGKLNGFPAVMLYSGVGKVNAAVAAQVMIDYYGVEFIVNAGVCGGIAEGVDIFDTVITEKAAYHDADRDILTEFHPFMPDIYFKSDPYLLQAAKHLAAADPTVHIGVSVTGDRFIAGGEREKIKAELSPLSADMETAAIAQVCYANGMPFIAVRTVTDNAACDGAENFEANCLKASEISKNLVIKLMREVADSPRAFP